MSMSASTMLFGIGAGTLAEVLLFFLLRYLFRLDGKSAGLAIGLLVLLIYVPWAILNWPGADVFAIHLAIFLTVAYALGMVGGQVGRGWHWAPVLIVAFFVLVVVTNVIFLGVAEQGITGLFAALLPQPRDSQVVDSQFPGTVSHDFQEKEALYNEYLRQVELQRERGWQVRKGWLSQPVVGQPATFAVVVSDRDGGPISEAAVSGRFLRSSNSRDDFDFAMSERAPGEYRAKLQMPLHGVWELVLQIRRGEDMHEIRAETSVEPGDGQGQ